MKLFIRFILIRIIFLISFLPTTALAERFEVTIDPSQVYDGDTIMNVHLTSEATGACAVADLRLLGLNAPEIRTKDDDEKRRGYITRDWLRERIGGKPIEIEASGRGKFGRVLSVIYIDGENVNKELLKKDLAVPFMEDI